MIPIMWIKQILMPMIFCFASIPAKNKPRRPYEILSDDDVHVKNKRFAFPNDQFYFKTTQ